MDRAKAMEVARRAGPWAALAALLAVTALAYAPSLDGGLVLDDDRVVERNMELRGPDALLLPPLKDMLGTGRPLTSVTFALDIRDGLDPRRLHRTSLLLHLLATFTVFVFVRRLLARVGHVRAGGVALVVTALFALHPIQMESAAYVTQRAEVLASILFLWALLLLDEAARRAWAWTGLLAGAAGVVVWVFAMAAKAIAISLPGVFVADQLVLAPAGERGWGAARRRGARAVLLALPVAALAAWGALVQLGEMSTGPSGGAGFSATPLSSGQYLLTQLRVQWLYLRLLAWPSGLSIDRPFRASRSLDPAAAIAAVGIVAVVALAFRAWSRAERGAGDAPSARPVAFGIFFWFIVLTPTSSIVPVQDLAVEHRVYLASLGVFLATVVAADALLFGRLAPRTARIAATALSVAVVSTLGLALHARARVWSSPAGVWREARAVDPASTRIVINLATVLGRAGDVAGAEVVFREAWATVKDPRGIVMLALNNGALLVVSGRPVEALAVLDRALPYDPVEPAFWSNRAWALGMLNRKVEALVDARRAATGEPWNPLFRNLLGVALVANGNVDEAKVEFAAAESLDPGNPEYAVIAARALLSVGRTREACATYRRVRATSKVRPLPRDAVTQAARIGCPIE